MITCYRCWFGHRTAEEHKACNSPHEFVPDKFQPELCNACGHSWRDEQHERFNVAPPASQARQRAEERMERE